MLKTPGFVVCSNNAIIFLIAYNPKPIKIKKCSFSFIFANSNTYLSFASSKGLKKFKYYNYKFQKPQYLKGKRKKINKNIFVVQR